jgi:hypothetical protein
MASPLYKKLHLSLVLLCVYLLSNVGCFPYVQELFYSSQFSVFAFCFGLEVDFGIRVVTPDIFPFAW